MQRAARIRVRPVKNAMIRLFIGWYGVDTGIALKPSPSDYADFNSFFTRRLKPAARPIVSGVGEIATPVDGTVSQSGTIDEGIIIQAKGMSYGLRELLGGSEQLATTFGDGSFATLYLSPSDYHRIHMPLDGHLQETCYVPGRLYSVNHYSTRHVHRLFARNERLVALFDTAAGPMALVLVGAIFVSGIETVWGGLIEHRPRGKILRTDYRDRTEAIHVKRGDEVGRFNMGSTVIVVFSRGRVQLTPELRADARVRMGQLLGRVTAPITPDRC